jgi:hypothetical protein
MSESMKESERTMQSKRTILAAAVTIGAVASGPALAQTATEDARELTLERRGARFTDAAGSSFDAGFEFQFGSGIGGGGDMDVYRGDIGFSTRQPLGRDWSINLSLDYGVHYYDFQGDTIFGGPEPWQDIHEFTTAVSVNYTEIDDWTIFGGGFFRVFGESGADFGDSYNGGGFFGAYYRFDENLTLGGGLRVSSQLEDSTWLAPMIVLDWQITDNLRLSSRTGVRRGLELIWEPDPKWELAVGGGFQRFRFRLDDSGFAPDGVVEDTGWPVGLRITSKPNRSLRLSVYGGVVLGGELEVDDRDGNSLRDEDYDPAGILGIAAQIRF